MAEAYCVSGLQAVKKLVEEEFPEIQVVKTDSLHHGVPGARHSFLPIPGDTDKLQMLSQVRGQNPAVICLITFADLKPGCQTGMYQRCSHHMFCGGLPPSFHHVLRISCQV